MTTIIFIRHGESETNKFIHQDPNDPHLSDKLNALGDPHLTENGKSQAKQVGTFLASKLDGKKVRVLTSLFTRTNETAKPFLELYAKNITMHERLELLSEYTKPEKNLTKEHLEKGLRNHQSWNDFVCTIKEFVDMLEDMSQCNDDPIVIFGHSLYLSALTSYLGSSLTFMPEKTQLTFRFPNCSITTFQYSQGCWKIFNVASIAHLSENATTGTECEYGTQFCKTEQGYIKI